MAFACDTSGNMKILAGKIDNSTLEILTSESGVLRYEEVSGETVNPFTVDADTLGGSTKEEIISEAQSGVDLSAYATAENLSSHTGNTNNPHGVTKAQVGLGNVDNTADSQKSVNYANSAGSAGSANTAGTASNAHSAANPDPGTASLKNIQAGTGDIGVGAGLATGTIYLVYE